ncbi:MAG: hypothetical protein WBZ36_02755, partial [Candidatus Nitrosopolaris sp.]
QKILDNLIKSANEEIMITLPSKTTTTNIRPYQHEQKYLLQLLRDVELPAGARRLGLTYFFNL